MLGWVVQAINKKDACVIILCCKGGVKVMYQLVMESTLYKYRQGTLHGLVATRAFGFLFTGPYTMDVCFSIPNFSYLSFEQASGGVPRLHEGHTS